MELCCFSFLNSDVAWLLLLLAACVLLLYLYGNQPYGLWKTLGVPGPEPSIFLGNMSELYGPETAKAIYAKWQSKYGRVYGIYCFRYPSLVITDPELIKQVLVKDFNDYRDRFSHDGDALTNREVDTGLFFARGETWKRIRGTITPSFSILKIKSMTGIVNNSAKRLGQHVLESAKKGIPLDAKLLYGAFAMDVVTGTAFSIDVDSVSNFDEPFTRHGRSLFTYKKSLKYISLLTCAFPTLAYPLLKLLNVGFFKWEDMDFFNRNIRRMIDERMAKGNNDKRIDFLQLLIDIMDAKPGEADKSKKLDKSEIVAQGIMLFIAGYETASSTLQFMSYELASHPEVVEKMVAEINQVVGENEPTYDMCLNLKYTEAAINETLRMYPPLSVLTRQSDKPVTLNGINLPTGTGVTIPMYVLGRDPEFWTNPEVFDPDRFLEDSGSPAFDPSIFIPFGMGPRICVGMKLGMMEVKLALIQVLRRVVFTRATSEKLHIEDFTAILQPSVPIMIHVSPRTESSTAAN